MFKESLIIATKRNYTGYLYRAMIGAGRHSVTGWQQIGC